jgi:hypothetical protein
MLSFAISAGEGTLLAYGTVDQDTFAGVVGALEQEYEERGEDPSDHLTAIIGPEDGTGE